jgi:hypothetical protein
MPDRTSGYLGPSQQQASLAERARALSTGAKLVLSSCVLLFFALFLTWQTLQIRYGQTATATEMQDGWDFWGLLIGFVAVALVTLVVIVHASDVDISPDVPWEGLVLGLASLLLGLTVLKNLTDADSAWVSYLAIGLAAVAVAGAYLDWSRARELSSAA